ncbi:protein lev-9-like [Saccostrea cucullata]|uniref:protein lev-9-like n=1 Tax=Saccostrea cuccullata TaxID=36930 RepID=UPI002ED1B0D3
MALTCSSPTSVSNGFYVIAKVTYQSGDYVAYYCKMGYELDGNQIRWCDGASGAWNGTTPKCTQVTTTTIITTTAESTSQISGS